MMNSRSMLLGENLNKTKMTDIEGTAGVPSAEGMLLFELNAPLRNLMAHVIYNGISMQLVDQLSPAQ